MNQMGNEWVDSVELAKMLGRCVNGALRKKLRAENIKRCVFPSIGNGRIDREFYLRSDVLRWIEHSRKPKEKPVAKIGAPRGIPWNATRVAHEISQLRKDVDFLYQFVGAMKQKKDVVKELFDSAECGQPTTLDEVNARRGFEKEGGA